MKPTFVLVCGAWHLPPYWDPLITSLTDACYDSVAVTPRSVNAKSPVTDLQPDVDAVKQVITDLVNKGKDVIVVMHSYGGCVGTEAVGDLVDGNRELATKIKRLVYLAGWYPTKGQAVAHACAGLAPTIGDPNVCSNPSIYRITSLHKGYFPGTNSHIRTRGLSFLGRRRRKCFTTMFPSPSAQWQSLTSELSH